MAGHSVFNSCRCSSAIAKGESAIFPLNIMSMRRICHKFLNETCMDGDKCKDLHDKVEFSRRIKRLVGVCHDIPIDQSTYWLLPNSPKLDELSEMQISEIDPAACYERSKDKMCSICLEVVMEKERYDERRFGLLPNCKHIFCLYCIRQWHDKQFYQSMVMLKTCPECRTASNYCAPSTYHVDGGDGKLKLFHDYRVASQDVCCHFDEMFILRTLEKHQ